MSDNNSASTNSQSPSHSAADLVPRLLRSLSKAEPTQQVASAAGAEQTLDRRMPSEQNTTALARHFTKLVYRGKAPRKAGVATENSSDSEWLSQTPHAIQTPIDARTSGGDLDSVVADEPGRSPEPITIMFAKRIQDVFSTIPSFASSISKSSQLTPSAPPQTDAGDIPSPVWDSHSPTSSMLPKSENNPSEHGWQAFWSALDRFRPLYSKKPETESTPEPSRDEILDCIDDNNSVMMYGPLEPDDTSEVEIACSEIVSINGDGEEIRTPQPCYTPLPSESIDEELMGCGTRSPPPRYVQLPLEFDEVPGGGGRSPQSRFVPLPLQSIGQVLRGGSGISPRSHFVPLPSQSIDQVLSGDGGGGFSVRGMEGESESVSDAPPVPPTTEAAAPVKEYRVWLPSLTKLSVQTMWWGFRIYLPPPVLDVLNNKQLEAAKRAALITTALQWLMDHLPVSLLPPHMRPGVAILRHLVPYVGYMGGFIAWTWSAIRSFDKGYGVVLTATWLLPFLLIPGTWEAEQVPNSQISPPVSP